MSASKRGRKHSPKSSSKHHRKHSPKSSSKHGTKHKAKSVGEVNRCRYRTHNQAWLEEFLAHFFLHDDRRSSRLLLCLAAMLCRPSASLNQTMIGKAAKSGLSTLLSSPLFRFVDLVSGMARACAARVRELGLREVLVVQDTTSFNYSHHPGKTGFGDLGGPESNPGYGFFCHGSLVVSPDGVPLGPVDLDCWVRDPEKTGRRHDRRKVPYEGKESFRWLKCLLRTMKRLPRNVSIITVCDREADIWELFAEPRPRHAHLIVRARHDRALVGRKRHLFAEVKQAKALGYYKIEVRVPPTHKVRMARLKVQVVCVWLKASAYGVGKRSKDPVPVTVIRVSEPRAPKGAKPIEWVLLTDMPVNSFDDARRFIRYYSYRWLIERLHYTLKSGCKLEECQVETYERMVKVLAMYAVVAWRLLWFTYITRVHGDGPCTLALTTMQWRVLYRVYHREAPPEEPISLAEAMKMIAVLGGHSGRRHDGPPGVKALWTGLMLLYALVQGVLDAWMEHPDARLATALGEPPWPRPLPPRRRWGLPPGQATCSRRAGTARRPMRYLL